MDEVSRPHVVALHSLIMVTHLSVTLLLLYLDSLLRAFLLIFLALHELQDLTKVLLPLILEPLLLLLGFRFGQRPRLVQETHELLEPLALHFVTHTAFRPSPRYRGGVSHQIFYFSCSFA